MTREEIIKIFEENHIAEGNATINATKLAEIFTKHESDLLKEFVEWERKNLCERFGKEEPNTKRTDESDEYIAFHEGILNGLMWAHDWLNNDLERFLEERK